MNTTRFQQRLAFASLLFLVAVLATAALGQAPQAIPSNLYRSPATKWFVA